MAAVSAISALTLTSGGGLAAADPANSVYHAGLLRHSPGRMITRFVAANMTQFTSSQAYAVSIAKSYDVIVAEPTQFKGYLPAMRAANPNLTILVYLPGPFALPTQVNSFPSSWYLYDAKGNKLATSGDGSILMNPASAGWIKNRVQTCESEDSGYDGCLLDLLGPAALQPGYLTGTPIDPATNKPYQLKEWLVATTHLAATVSKAISPLLLTGNGLGSGYFYFQPGAPASQLFGGMVGGEAEDWIHSPSAPATAYPPETGWLSNVNMLIDAAAKGRSVMTITKTWGTGTKAQIDAMHRFALASFLLGTDGNQYFSFSASHTADGVLYDSPWEHVDVGAPSGSYTHSGYLYERQFTKGLAAVNPTTSAASVSLSTPMCNLAGTKVSSERLGADGADVFYVC